MLGAWSQLGHASELQASVVVFINCRLWNHMRRRSDRVIKCLAMRMIRNAGQLVEDDRHDFLQNFSDWDEIAHRLTQSDILCLHSAQCNLSLHLGCPHERSSSVSDHISCARFDTNGILFIFDREQSSKICIDITINPQFRTRFQDQTIRFRFL